MQAHRLPLRAGRAWLPTAFALYRKNPPLLLSACMAYFLAGALLAVLGPLVFVLPIVQPLMMVMLANVYALAWNGGTLSRAVVLRTVVEHRPALLKLGLIQFALSGLVTLISLLVEWLVGVPADLAHLTVKDILVHLLPMLLLMIPVFMAFCFAPVLTAWHEMPPAKAMFFSFVATWRNLGAFAMHFLNCTLVIMAAGFVLVAVGSLSSMAANVAEYVLRLVMLMVFMPTMMASIYVAYLEIFERPNEVEAA